MYSDKQGVNTLIETLVEKGLKHVVLSPGSRNAPIALTCYHHPDIDVVVIPDERSAAYFALGMAQHLQTPVAVVCTSGTAALNYSPAIAEAFYQSVPLLILTADRPVAWVDQADGQTIHQRNIYSNYCKTSFEIPGDGSSPEELWFVRRISSQAYDECLLHGAGPVHINIPLSEPLYNRSKALTGTKAIQTVLPLSKLAEHDLQQLAQRWNASSKKLILTGLLAPDKYLNDLVKQLTYDSSVAVITETTSNLHHENFNPCIDRIVSTIREDEREAFRPDLLLTFGGPVISKKIKFFIRNNPPKEHWHIDISDLHLDTFQCLTHSIPLNPIDFLKQFVPLVTGVESEYGQIWKSRDEITKKRHDSFLAASPMSDLLVFQFILKHLPAQSNLHMANSSPVRYVQLFNPTVPLYYYSNRGASGIDGCTSTAAGMAYLSERPTTIITGDIGFFYDSNALWNNYLSDKFRIVLINNGGGGIFRIIDGPDNNEEIEFLLETRQEQSAEYICKAFGVRYFSCRAEEEIEAQLNIFFDYTTPGPALIELFTPTEENPKILKNYFAHLNKD